MESLWIPAALVINRLITDISRLFFKLDQVTLGLKHRLESRAGACFPFWSTCAKLLQKGLNLKIIGSSLIETNDKTTKADTSLMSEVCWISLFFIYKKKFQLFYSKHGVIYIAGNKMHIATIPVHSFIFTSIVWKAQTNCELLAPPSSLPAESSGKGCKGDPWKGGLQENIKWINHIESRPR